MFSNTSLAMNGDTKWLIATENPISNTFPFHLLEAGHFYAETGFYQELSVPTGYCFVFYTVSGAGSVLSGSKEISVKEETSFVLDDGHRHAIKNDAAATWEFKWIYIKGSGLQAYVPHINDDGPRAIFLDQGTQIESRLDYLIGQTPYSDLHTLVTISDQVTNLMSQLIICRHNSLNCKNYLRHRRTIAQVINYIQKNYNKQISIDDLISIVNMSKYYFLKLFKQYIGLSPYDYILNYRINQAKKLLRTTSYSVGSIGEMVGFTYESNFIKQFKRLTGTTPMNYRK